VIGLGVEFTVIGLLTIEQPLGAMYLALKVPALAPLKYPVVGFAVAVVSVDCHVPSVGVA
jgi:hypothetical protein